MIRRARRDGSMTKKIEMGNLKQTELQRLKTEERKAEDRGNEEREKREDEKGSHCFFKSSGYDKLELNQNLVFSSL